MAKKDRTDAAKRAAAKKDPPTPGVIGRLGSAFDALRITPSEPVTSGADDATEMIGVVGSALLDASQATSDVESDLRHLADAYERDHLEFAVLPTIVMVSDAQRSRVFNETGTALRLDQIAALEHAVRHAVEDKPPVDEVVEKVREIRAAPPRFPWVWQFIGHIVLTLGFGLVLNPTLTALPAYAVLGALVGAVVMIGSRLSTLSLILPVITAFIVTAITALGLAHWVGEDPLRIVAPPLASFLPGLLLTIAAVELTRGQIIAGASRLVYGVAKLVLLAFGVYAGLQVVGHLPSGAADDQLGWWAPWVGIVLCGIGYSLWSSAPKGALPWVIAALAVAHAAQLLGNLLVGAELSGFVGAVVVSPFALLASRFRNAPPPIVLTICGFWILVPGSLGFMAITEAATDSSQAMSTLFSTALAVISISIGMLVGSGLSRDVGAIRRAWKTPATGS